jgi:hypothetical protein
MVIPDEVLVDLAPLFLEILILLGLAPLTTATHEP